jgi:hypothetical protein
MDWGRGEPAEEDMSLTIWSDGIFRSAIIEVLPLSVCIFFARARRARASHVLGMPHGERVSITETRPIFLMQMIRIVHAS